MLKVIHVKVNYLTDFEKKIKRIFLRNFFIFHQNRPMFAISIKILPFDLYY